jgi:hypothetical protein
MSFQIFAIMHLTLVYMLQHFDYNLLLAKSSAVSQMQYSVKWYITVTFIPCNIFV